MAENNHLKLSKSFLDNRFCFTGLSAQSEAHKKYSKWVFLCYVGWGLFLLFVNLNYKLLDLHVSFKGYFTDCSQHVSM